MNTSGSLPNLVTTHAGSLTRHAEVIGVRENLVTIEAKASHIVKNEVAYVCVGNLRLKAEVLRIHGTTADLQVYEETGGIAVGQAVELTGEMLSVTLSPGLLGQVFDGLQNPLPVLAQQHGFFLPRGIYAHPVDLQRKWAFTPLACIGATLRAGEVIGTVQEGRFTHKIMVPFNQTGPMTVAWIHEGHFTANAPVARISGVDGKSHDVTMIQRWPIRRPLPEAMLQKQLVERIYPSEPLITSIRLIDTFFPIARGGTACIPGPFGAGKTVLQSLIARFSNIDIVIIVACGERAGEVVETITEFPNLADPRTGGSLMDRTIIICNTSSMPVAARESSIYTGMALGEYFRQMGYHVLVIADSTSRWAQAIRETSGRMEEIPGEEAFPAYLDSNIKSIYERAGVIKCSDGSIGSVTMIGTVSPAGGNFEEPVTQSTLSTVKTFLGLSSDRAYRRFYPAVDPLISWSRYSNQLQPWYEAHLDSEWSEHVQASLDLLRRGDAVFQMMQVTGEEGISLEDYVTWQKGKFLDMVYLQQDAFDEVDSSTSLDRQKESFQCIRLLLEKDYQFANPEEAREFFTRLTDLYKNLNYSPFRSDEHTRYQQAIETLTNQFLFLRTKE